MKWFNKHVTYVDPIEQRFDAMMRLIKDLSKADYKRLCEAMDLGWESYQRVRNVKTPEERAEEKLAKECSDIDTMERVLEKTQ